MSSNPAEAPPQPTGSDLELLRRRAERYARRVESEARHVATVVVFLRGEARYALPLEELREIRPLRGLCPIPGASPVVPGVVHHRGSMLSVHDLAALFRPDARPPEPHWLLLVEHGGERLGLMAEEVSGVEPVAESGLGQPPLTVGPAAAVLSGVLTDGTLVLNPSSLFTHREFFAAF